MAVSDDVDRIVLYRHLPFWAHGYIWPFVLLYLTLIICWLYVFEGIVYLEAFFISVAVIGVLNIVTCLTCVWSVHIRCWMICRKVATIESAHLAKVVPTPNNGSTELVQIKKDVSTSESIIWFRFQEVKYVFDNDRKSFLPILFPVDCSAAHYTSWTGLSNNNELETAQQKYGLNKLNVVLPDFWVLFRERATAPFFIFQVFCVGLWCLDEYWYYSIFTLVMLVLFEVLLVKQQQRNLSEIKKMSSTPHLINVFRAGRWCKLSTNDLVPGDIVSLCRSRDGYYVPCDILLLRGSCIVDESMLTGESVPQMKEPLESSILQSESFDIERDGRLHVVYGGTMVVQNSPPSKASGLKAPDNGCVGYVLRTGFNTSQGKLLRTILYGVKRVTANNLESFMFILFLLIFAITASAYVWIKGSEDPNRNRYKLFLECTLILTSVVPPELPIELSLAVNTSLISLVKMGIYCTEPFRIPFGGKVDICCFDKTGTLTSEDLVVEGIAGLSSESNNDSSILVPPLATPQETQYVLASCHSLAMLDGELVGDPLEKAVLISVEWRISKGDTVTPLRGRRTSINIIHRFHFSSLLKRMSTVSQLTTPSSSVHIAAVKGAPEVIKKMLSVTPVDYDETYLKLARRGARVLALGYRNLGHLSMRDANLLTREEVEKELQFVGFITISCPLKKQSKESIKTLKNSSHHVVMITGDNPLTACHVAKELRIATKELLLLQQHNTENGNNEEWQWENVDGDTVYPLEREKRLVRQFGSKYDLTLTGDGIAYLLSIGSSQWFHHILPFVKVFARVSPKQKELIINSYKSLGYYTLMCGDGTNDVGALKHAHVGVSLLSTVRIKKKAIEDTQEKPRGDVALTRSPIQSMRHRKTPTSATALSQQDSDTTKRSKLLQELIKQSEESLQDPSLVRLGDASIASPFTARETTIKCICQVIRQGRCTLVTTLQMFKILALNALVLAYSQSVLYLDGIKFSDAQATIQGMLLAGCFLFISRSKPLDTLSKERPLPNIFNIYTILTVIIQFLVHFFCLVYLVQEAKIISPPIDGYVDLDKDFEQNALNSAVFLISVSMQVSNFAVNYKGRPFMMGLKENKPLLICLMITSSIVLALASGLFPELCEYLEIVEFPEDFQRKLFVVLIGDFIVSFVADTTLSYLFGTAKLRQP